MIQQKQNIDIDIDMSLMTMLENIKITLPTKETICVQDLIANVLPIALPPTVNPATSADIKSVTSCGTEKAKFCSTCAAMVAEAEPETTPQISPTTSLQMELTRSALRRSWIA